MSVAEWRKMNREQLEAALSEQAKQLIKLRFQKASGELNSTHLLKQAKRNIARIKTIQQQKVAEHG